MTRRHLLQQAGAPEFEKELRAVMQGLQRALLQRRDRQRSAGQQRGQLHAHGRGEQGRRRPAAQLVFVRVQPGRLGGGRVQRAGLEYVLAEPVQRLLQLIDMQRQVQAVAQGLAGVAEQQHGNIAARRGTRGWPVGLGVAKDLQMGLCQLVRPLLVGSVAQQAHQRLEQQGVVGGQALDAVLQRDPVIGSWRNWV